MPPVALRTSFLIAFPKKQRNSRQKKGEIFPHLSLIFQAGTKLLTPLSKKATRSLNLFQ